MIKRGLVFGLVFLFLVGFFLVSSNEVPWDVGGDVLFTHEGVQCDFGQTFSRWVNITIGEETAILEDIFKNGSNQVANCSIPDSFKQEPDSWNGSVSCCPEGFSCNSKTGNCEISGGYCAEFETRPDCLGSNEKTPDGDRLRTPAYFYFKGNQESERLGNESDSPSIYDSVCKEWAVGSPIELSEGAWAQNWSKCVCAWRDDSCFASHIHGQQNHKGEDLFKFQCEIKTTKVENFCDQSARVIRQHREAKLYNVTQGNNGPPLDKDNHAILYTQYSCSINSPRDFPCDAVVVVPFFTFANFFVALMSISLIYFFFRKSFLKKQIFKI